MLDNIYKEEGPCLLMTSQYVNLSDTKKRQIETHLFYLIELSDILGKSTYFEIVKNSDTHN